MSLLSHVVAVVLLAAIPCAANAQPARQLIHLRGDLYLIQEGDQATVILIAPEAALLADPLGVGTGEWIRDELAARFSARPVRYVVYTTPVFKRTAGGAAFPKATFVGHADFNSKLLMAAARSLPATVAPLDANQNGRLERVEWSGSDLAPQLTGVDANKDGVLTSREVYRIVPFAGIKFRDRATLSVGSRNVEIVNPHGTSSTPAVLFPEEGALYIGTHPAFAPDGFSFGDMDPRSALAWLRGAAAVAFDAVVTGRGRTMTRGDFDAVVRYAEDLFAAAVDAYTAGASPRAVAAAPALQKYAGTAIDARRQANIETIFHALRVTRTEVYGAGIARWTSPRKAYCAGYDACTEGDRVAGGTGGIRVTMSRMGAVLEVTMGEQFLTQREGALDDEAFAQRSSRGSLLFRYGPIRPTSRSIDLLAGATLIVADTRGVTRVKQALAPFGGRHEFSERTTAIGITGGVNLVAPMTRWLGIVMPVRVTVLPSVPESRWPGKLDVQGGVGFSFQLTQRVR